ncbi:MAG TPA: fasciclin domain-containing protein [Thermoleophilia bacterium]|nr:fasciclin domain-containing protein [Thermoleophilia bacterium]
MTRRTILPLAALVLALLLAAVALSACGGSSTPSDVATALKDNDQVSQYSDAFAAAGISGNGPYTVVAATNDALTKAGVKLDSDAVKASVIQGTDVTKADAVKGAKWDAMLPNNTIYSYTGTDGQLYVNSYKVVGDPITTGNGTVYIVDGVIQPK